MTPFQNYLKEGILPEDEGESTRIRRLAASYLIIDGELYRRGYSTPYLRCVALPETEKVLREAHEGAAACHEGARSLSRKIFRLGYYWPTLGKDAAELTQKCEICQQFAPRSGRPSTLLSPMAGAWPFAQWGIDILGPFPISTGQRTHIIVAIDYFTKWVEAKALASTMEFQVIKFMQVNIFSRFGIPKILISDNGP
jgi:hypothetical protein